MSNYFQSMHHKPYGHRRAFALAVSGGATLVIFTLWSFVTFGRTTAVAENTGDTNNLAAVVDDNNALADSSVETTPFDNVKSGFASSFEAIRNLITHSNQDVKNSNGQQ